MAIAILKRRWLQAGAAAVLASSLVVQGGAASAADPATGEEAAAFNGQPGQWSGVPSASAELVQSLQVMKAVQQDGKLKLMVRGPGLEGKGIWYIDADGDEKTGIPAPYWANGGGIDFKVSAGQMWKAANGKWVSAGPVATKTVGDTLEAEVDLAALGAGDATIMRTAFMLAGDQYLPAPGKRMLVVPPAAGAEFGPDVQVTVDGLADDWSAVKPAAQSADGQTSLYAAEEGNSLVLLVVGKLAEFNDIYLDTDRSADTGYADVGWPSFGGDWLIENGALYKSTGAGWNWGPVDGANIEYKQAGAGDKLTVEYRIPLASIGITAPKAIAVGFTSNDVTVPSADLRPPLVAPPLPKLKADGDPSEWASLPTTATGTGKAKLLKAFADAKTLNVLAKAESFDAETNLFINSDNNADTGYNGWEYKRTGADYLVQNGKLFRYAGPGWAWEEIGPAEWQVSAKADADGLKSLEVRVDLSAEANAGGTMRVAIGVGEDYAPAVDAEGEYALASGRGGAPIVIDGQPGDWASVDNAAVGTGETVRLTAAQDDDKIYLLAEAASVDTRNVFYLDTDANAKTGFKDTAWTGFGADAKIEFNKLYLYDGKNAKWKEAGPVRAEIEAGRALFYFYRDQLGLKKAGALAVGYVGQDAYRLPAAGGSALALKKSVAARAADKEAYIPRERFGVLDNPFMGWAGWANATTALEQPHKLVYANIAWRDLEPEKGKFDWAGIEEKFQFAKWKAEGTRINLRFVLDDPGDDPDMDIPQWLYDELVKAEGGSGAGKWYDTPDTVVGKGFAPNYASPTLIAEHERVMTALGQRYDNDPLIAFVQIGSLGHWGEFHNWPEEVSGAFPSLAVSDQYVEQYLRAFPHKLIGMRKPFPIAASKRLGLFNDVFGSKGATDEWLNWTEEGWNGIGPYVEAGQDPAAVQAASKMPDFWKFNFSGGEFYNGNPLLSLSNDTIMETLRQTRASHTSWMGPSSPAPFRLGKDIDAGQQANIDLMHNTMGYRFVLESASHAAKASPGRDVTLRMTWNNKGVAPFYAAWPLALALVDAQGRLAEGSVQRVGGVDVREWLPGRHALKADYKLPAGLAAGSYKLAVAILDPDTGKPGVHLGIEGERGDGWTTLDRLQVAR
ncbi:DUF4832 domain-containing protein [Cohnella nanjingensis]|uniref:DUF4832 domain-containing protein n=1 Tax=Cohnella nanjingensis TaxID=1387779 RepID=A0A7X0RQ70_9BACL|nr:DUF4832 domain-containing protein [Cohnella nanjingensis]MBB6670471.1 DUF4832 domain-containing protein [Cohnella nanjingensis]